MNTISRPSKHKATSHNRWAKDDMIILIGVEKPVEIPFCPACGCDFKAHKVKCQTTHLRFKCPECHTSIENTRVNRCPVCQVLCSDSDTYNAHCLGGCER